MLANPASNSRAQTPEASRCDRTRLASHRAHARKPWFAASRLPSFQTQTKTGTVAGRFPALRGQSQLRFTGSGPHSPPRWRTRERRSDVFLPLARKERFLEPVWPANRAWPWGSALPKPAWPDCPSAQARSDTRTEAFLRNLLTIPENLPPGQFFLARRQDFCTNGPKSAIYGSMYAPAFATDCTVPLGGVVWKAEPC